LIGLVNMQLVDMLAIASAQDFTDTDLNFVDQNNRTLMVWKENRLVVHQGGLSLEKPDARSNYIHKVDGHNWVVAQDCHAMLAIFAAITTTLKPIDNLAKTVSGSTPERLGPLSERNQSQELLPLVKALNRLIENMRLQLQKERQFLDTCSHEIRTPVTALVAHIQSIDFADEKLQSKFVKIQQSALRTVRVTNQFLMLGRNQNSMAMESEETRFDLCEIVRRTSADHMQECSQLHCQMYGKSSLYITADMFAVELALRNIIENSIKYGANSFDSKVEVLISVEENDGKAIIVIEDSGDGVSAEKCHRLLERFYRAHVHQETGAGLGLSIVQATAQVKDSRSRYIQLNFPVVV